MRIESERAKDRYSTSAQMCFDSLQAKRNLSEMPEMETFSLRTQFHGPQIISDVCFSHMTVYSMYLCTVCAWRMCMGVHPTLVWRSEEDPMESLLPPTFTEVTGIKLRSTRLAHYDVDLLSHLSSLLMSSFVYVLEENKVAGWTVLPIDMVSPSCTLLQCCLALLIFLHSSGFLFAHCLLPCTRVTGTEWPVVTVQCTV